MTFRKIEMIEYVPIRFLVYDPRLGGDLNIGYPCGHLWCETNAQVREKERKICKPMRERERERITHGRIRSPPSELGGEGGGGQGGRGKPRTAGGSEMRKVPRQDEMNAHL